MMGTKLDCLVEDNTEMDGIARSIETCAIIMWTSTVLDHYCFLHVCIESTSITHCQTLFEKSNFCCFLLLEKYSC